MNLNINTELIRAITCFNGISKQQLYNKLNIKDSFNYTYFCKLFDGSKIPTDENIKLIQSAISTVFTTSELIEILKIQIILEKKRG